MKAQTHVRLSQTDVKYLEGVIGTGKPSARQFKRAMALLELNRGKPITSVAETLGVTPRTVGRLRNRYVSQGLACLEDQPRSGRPIKIDGTQRAKITALACSAAPSGRGQWALRLLADKVVELGISDRISHTQVGRILKKTN